MAKGPGQRIGKGMGWGGPPKGAGSARKSIQTRAPFEPGNKVQISQSERVQLRRAQAEEVLDRQFLVATGQVADATSMEVAAQTAFANRVLGMPKQVTETQGEQTIIIKTGVPRANRD